MRQIRAATDCLLLILPVVVGAGCHDDGGLEAARFPYNPEETAIISPDATVIARRPDGDDCIDLPNGECVAPGDECGDSFYADVLLDTTGKVIEVVCLPIEDDTLVIDVARGVATLPDGNDDDVISNLVEGTIGFSGAPDECRDNRGFDDVDDDGVLDADEARDAEPLPCGG